ncbi:hypothetical protein, partial [Aneurinibacillus migulanus]|uniref:hypothetical protein n=1 Tax=Aneurinibacillus migulanus TaxID=47500 RepID=UPI000A84E737
IINTLDLFISLLKGLFKTLFAIFIWFCFVIVFANIVLAIAGMVFGNTEGMSEFIGTAIVFIIFITILGFFAPKTVRSVFEFFVFGNFFGIPAGLGLLSVLIFVNFPFGILIREKNKKKQKNKQNAIGISLVKLTFKSNHHCKNSINNPISCIGLNTLFHTTLSAFSKEDRILN